MVKKQDRKQFLLPGLFGLVILILASGVWVKDSLAQESSPEGILWITGGLVDSHGQPIVEAEIAAVLPDGSEMLAKATSQENGRWSLALSGLPDKDLQLHIERAHFESFHLELSAEELDQLRDAGSLAIPEIALNRKIGAGFWAATVVFVLVLLVIAFEKLHSTTASLAAMSALMLISSVVGTLNRNWFIFSFERALSYINWEVIFLVMGMMIIIAIIEGTGIFQWTAFQAYRLSGGRNWLLALILMAVTAVASALLDNFTTMLLMTPISLQIGLALGINPLALIIPEVLASNVGGITTLIGTPTNILIGAHAGIGFNDFLINQTPGVLLALIGMAVYILYHYRDELKTQSEGISPRLYDLLKKRGQVKDPETLKKSGLVFGLVLVGFVLGERVHMVPAIPALVGATLLLIWLKPNVQELIKAVDWTTLVFFMALFIVVGAVQEVGLISFIADGMSRLIGENLALGIFVIVIGVGTLSTGIANIPLTASMLPVVDFLTGNIPGASSKALYYALSMGAAMGGNGMLIGAEANLVTAGITQQAGQPISFKEFLKVGIPVTYISLFAGYLWLLIRFVFFG